MSDIRPIPIDLRNHLGEITGNELKVWLAYFLHSDYELTSYPSNRAIEAETGVSLDTVKTCKASLRLKGWLRYTGDSKQPRRAGGEFKVPVMEASLPWRDEWAKVVVDVCMTYDAITVAEKTTHGGTEVEKLHHRTVVGNFHPEGSCSGSGSGSSSFSPSTTSATTLSDSNKLSPPRGVRESRERIEGKSKPANLKPQPTATPSKPKSKGHAQDGTTYPEGFNDWSNLKRLHWLQIHGWKPGSMAEASQRTRRVLVADGKAKSIARHVAPAPHSASPPKVATKCGGCGGPEPCRDEWCYTYQAEGSMPIHKAGESTASEYEDENEWSDSISNTAPLDDWRKL